ncbi:hypothetical protein LUZ60_004361 [Juncus effusus]|nr:hypothetical protein LUZ60_004361 [Juncus effusus]
MANCFKTFLYIALALIQLANGEDYENDASDPFIKTQGTQFTLNGQLFLFNGFNSYWLMHVASGTESNRSKITEVFHEAKANGLSVCRTWAFSDGGDRALQLSPGVYDERVFQALDFVISEAKKKGIRLILSLVNNYNEYGGRAEYVKWAQDAGQVLNNSEDEFYTNSVVKTYYKNHVKTVLTRINCVTKVAYRDDPTIMAWELINEPRCSSDPSGRTLTAWAQEMANYTKSIDKKHLVEIGLEGFYGFSIAEKKQNNPPGYDQVGTDYITNNLIKEIDFATIHAYPDLWLPTLDEDHKMTFIKQWAWSHWHDARKILQKPLIFTEFGKSQKNPNFVEIQRDLFLEAIYQTIYDLAKKSDGSLGGGLVWQIMAEDMESYSDGYEIVLSKHSSVSSVITRHSHIMYALASMLNKLVAE